MLLVVAIFTGVRSIVVSPGLSRMRKIILYPVTRNWTPDTRSPVISLSGPHPLGPPTRAIFTSAQFEWKLTFYDNCNKSNDIIETEVLDYK